MRWPSLTGLVLLVACTPAIQVNHGYDRNVADKPKVAIVPMLNETSGMSDVAFEATFEDKKGRTTVVPVKPLRDRLQHDEALRKLLAAVAERAYNEDDLQRAPRIQDVVGDTGLEALRSAFGSADVLLFPVSFETKVSAGHIFGWMTYRLYDLHDGRIVFQNKKDLHVSPADENARRVLLLYFATFASTDFKEQFLDAK